MRYQEFISSFHYSWQQVAQGLWQRYPNPNSSHVLSEDTVARSVVDGKLHSTRVIIKTNRLPKWGERIVKARKVALVEHSVVDAKNMVIETRTANVGLTKFMSVIEQVTYKPCPENPEHTIAERKAWIDSKIFGLGYAIQKFGIDRYNRNIQKTDAGFIHVLSRLFPRPNCSGSCKVSSCEEAKKRLLNTANRAKEILQREKNVNYSDF